MATAVAQPPGTNINPLLQKPEIGQPTRRGFTLPHLDFTYGKSNQSNASGAGDAMASWTNTKNSQLSPLKAEANKRNFIAMNRMAPSCGLVNSQEQSQYRATQGNFQTQGTTKLAKSAPVSSMSRNRVFGVPTKPSTPVFDLLEHKYQEHWVKQNLTASLAARQREEQKSGSKMKSYCETRASRLRRYSPPVEGKPLWQMKRFQKQDPALQTFRTADARQKAFEHHKSDCTSRTGVFGHGTYENAKS